MVAVLNAIYEGDFGFQPRRSQHDALDALAYGIGATPMNWIPDADIKSFFDKIDQTLRPYGRLCMTRGQCGWLNLQCIRLSFTSLRRFNWRTEMIIMQDQAKDTAGAGSHSIEEMGASLKKPRREFASSEFRLSRLAGAQIRNPDPCIVRAKKWTTAKSRARTLASRDDDVTV